MSDYRETTNDGDAIACPRCGYVMRDLWDHGWAGEEDEDTETECGGCDEPIVIRRVVSVDYYARTVTP